MKNSPTVELLFSRYDAAHQRFLALEPGRHRILKESWPWLEWLRRQTGNDRLFVYYHTFQESFVLACWVYSPTEAVVPVCQELEVFHGSPSAWWPEDLMAPQTLLDRLRPAEEIHARILNSVKQRQVAERVQKDARHTEKREYVKHCRNIGLDQTAALVEDGSMPFAGRSYNPAFYDMMRSKF